MFDVLSGWPRHPRFRMYAGQADPHDPSHFTIRYRMWGQEDVLDGRLDDQDQITLTPRQPPHDKWWRRMERGCSATSVAKPTNPASRSTP